jgi:hypothetical protein
MSIPCVIGRLLPEASAMLEAAGVRVALVKQTRCPKAAPSGPLRVLRQRDLPDGVELVTAASAALARREGSDE